MFSPCPKVTSFWIDLAPLVDILFLLLIFFMVSSHFLKPTLDIDLPEITQIKSLADRIGIVVAIDHKAKIFLDGEPVLIHRLASRAADLMEQKSKNDILLQIDRHTPYYVFVQVVERLHKSGASSLSMETKLGMKEE